MAQHFACRVGAACDKGPDQPGEIAIGRIAEIAQPIGGRNDGAVKQDDKVEQQEGFGNVIVYRAIFSKHIDPLNIVDDEKAKMGTIRTGTSC